MNRVSNERVRHSCGITQLGVRIPQRRLKLFGHLLRKPDDELLEKLLIKLNGPDENTGVVAVATS